MAKVLTWCGCIHLCIWTKKVDLVVKKKSKYIVVVDKRLLTNKDSVRRVEASTQRDHNTQCQSCGSCQVAEDEQK